MITIYHNPRCSKSRDGVQFLKDKNQEFQIVKYLENPLTEAELTALLQKLKMKPIELVRKTETIWKEQYKGKELSDAEVITAMVTNPKLIERPIVEHNNKAIVGRPTEAINEVL